VTPPGTRQERGRGVPSARHLLTGSGIGLAASYWTLMSPYSQLLGFFPYRAPASGRVAALTFDDGPNEPYTSQIADFLDDRGIKATFFQVGRCVERHPDVTVRLARAGHVIGNHGYSHQFHRCLSRRALRKELRDAQQVFLRHLGRQPALYRPPWLLRTPALFSILRNRSLQAISGEFCHPLEVFQPAPERIARGVLAKVRPGSIIIFHDGFDARGGDRSSTVGAVKLVVNRMSQAGYEFTTVDRLLGVPAYGT
jgi:peptidoglycan-N-acetylglucosamine deacetylase